jgi:hypothetical protein
VRTETFPAETIVAQPASPEDAFAVVMATDRLLAELTDYLADPTPCANAALMQIVDDVYEKLETAFAPLGITPLARRRLARWVLTDAGTQALAPPDALEALVWADEATTYDGAELGHGGGVRGQPA